MRFQWRGVAGIVNNSIVQPANFVNKFLTCDISCLIRDFSISQGCFRTPPLNPPFQKGKLEVFFRSCKNSRCLDIELQQRALTPQVAAPWNASFRSKESLSMTFVPQNDEIGNHFKVVYALERFLQFKFILDFSDIL